LAELGEYLAVIDHGPKSGPGACSTFFSMDGKLTPEQQIVCDRQKERIALYRERHAKLCKELKIQGGKYGCK
jgi:hypothetical protein